MNIPAWVVLLATLSSGVLADTLTDQQSIEQMMRHTWERPNAPLQVGPVTVEGEHAVVGWTQGERGGRALLNRDHKGWRVVLCAGDSLLDPATLRSAGLTPEAATSLVNAVTLAESTQAPERLKQFALFKGIMQVNKHAAHHDQRH
ncbi:copper uptake system-associated protein [Pseudomonas protegens]|uniref:copper uptake system-associated protein n=1 Tax=Pseudomonas protegens TaxID=380021 RepID=UPI003905B568